MKKTNYLFIVIIAMTIFTSENTYGQWVSNSYFNTVETLANNIIFDSDNSARDHRSIYFGSNRTSPNNYGSLFYYPSGLYFQFDRKLSLMNKDNHFASWDNLTLYATGTRSVIESNGDEAGMFISSKTGNKISIGDNNDTIDINAKSLTLDYGRTKNDLAQVSINTDAKVGHSTLTVAGATYIGPKAEKAFTGTLSKFKPVYLKNYNLWVEDGIVTEDIAIVSVDTWKDIVFSDDYNLQSLKELEVFIKKNKHLPGIKSEALVKKEGYSIQEMDIALLEKVEELTLYTIEQDKKINLLTSKLEELIDIISKK